MTSHYDPEARVEEFLSQHGEIGLVVLRAFNTIDPLSCFFAPDEYLGYAKRFIEGLKNNEIYFNPGLRNESWPRFIAELVRRSFYAVQLAEGIWVREGAIEEIAHAIQIGITPRTNLG